MCICAYKSNSNLRFVFRDFPTKFAWALCPRSTIYPCFQVIETFAILVPLDQYLKSKNSHKRKMFDSFTLSISVLQAHEKIGETDRRNNIISYKLCPTHKSERRRDCNRSTKKNTRSRNKMDGNKITIIWPKQQLEPTNCIYFYEHVYNYVWLDRLNETQNACTNDV